MASVYSGGDGGVEALPWNSNSNLAVGVISVVAVEEYGGGVWSFVEAWYDGGAWSFVDALYDSRAWLSMDNP